MKCAYDVVNIDYLDPKKYPRKKAIMERRTVILIVNPFSSTGVVFKFKLRISINRFL